jgi:hypothetical protein
VAVDAVVVRVASTELDYAAPLAAANAELAEVVVAAAAAAAVAVAVIQKMHDVVCFAGLAGLVGTLHRPGD